MDDYLVDQNNTYGLESSQDLNQHHILIALLKDRYQSQRSNHSDFSLESTPHYEQNLHKQRLVEAVLPNMLPRKCNFG